MSTSSNAYASTSIATTSIGVSGTSHTGASTSTSTASTSAQTVTLPNSTNSLSTGAIVGISVGGTTAVIAIIAGLAIFFLRHRLKAKLNMPSASGMHTPSATGHGTRPQALQDTQLPYELASDDKYQADSRYNPSELYGTEIK